jgi:hypothetical protein
MFLEKQKTRPTMPDRVSSLPGLFSDFFNVAASRPAQMTTERFSS